MCEGTSQRIVADILWSMYISFKRTVTGGLSSARVRYGCRVPGRLLSPYHSLILAAYIRSNLVSCIVAAVVLHHDHEYRCHRQRHRHVLSYNLFIPPFIFHPLIIPRHSLASSNKAPSSQPEYTSFHNSFHFPSNKSAQGIRLATFSKNHVFSKTSPQPDPIPPHRPSTPPHRHPHSTKTHLLNPNSRSLRASGRNSTSVPRRLGCCCIRTRGS